MRLPWAEIDPVLWIVTVPFGLLGAAAAFFSFRNLLDGSGWLRFAGAAVGVPLGVMVAWLWVRTAARFILHLVAPERIEVKQGAALVQLRGDSWLRSRVHFEHGALTSLRLSAGQGGLVQVWLLHRDGPLIWLCELHAADARTLLLRLSA